MQKITRTFGLLGALALILLLPPAGAAASGEAPLGDGFVMSSDIQSTDGITLSPHVWQFRAAVAGSDGHFVDSNQSLGNASSYAVALGDLDGDGDLDAFVANATSRANKVWLNDGTGTFADSGQTLGNGSSYAVALGDLDADGDLDAFVGNSSSDMIWLNDGMGIFHASGQYLSGTYSEDVALGDLDGDGDLDAFVANGSDANRVWLNDGTGTFVDSGQRLGSADSEDVALGDLDGDGDLDAFVANSGGEANRVWLNDGSGSFSPSGQSLGSTSSFAVALGDLDGDGDLDAFVGNASGGDTVWLNDGAGSFSPSGQSLGSSYTYAVTLADVEGDGDLDGLVGTSSTGGNTIWLNDGTARFTDSGRALGGATAYGIALGDMDGDEDLDAFVAHSGANRVWLNRTTSVSVTATRPAGNGRIVPPTAVISATFSQPLSTTTVGPASFRVWGKQTGFYAQSYAVTGDTVFFDALPDYRPGEEVVAILSHDVHGMDGGTLSPYAWQFRAAVTGSDGRFVDSNQSLGNALSNAVALGDLDGDGDLDAFVANAINKANRVWLNDGTGTFTDSGQTLGDGSSYAIALGDFDADGDLDAFVGNSSNDEVWLNDGMGVFHDNGQYLSGSSTEGVALGDLDGDGDLDVFVANGSGANRVWLNDGTGTFFDGGQRLGSVDSEGVALGDLDADGDLDAFVANRDNEANRVWLNDGAGSFAAGPSLGSAFSYAVALGDFDADGDLDAFVGNAGNDEVWLNDGAGSFSPSGQSLGNISTYAVTLADVEGDGDLDVLVGTGSSDGNRIWLNNGTGYFTNGDRTLGGAPAYGIALGDLDEDGDLDAFVAHNGANRVWLNRTTALAVTATNPAGNDRIVPPTAVISATFSQPLSTTTVGPASFRVWGKQTGFYAQSYAVTGDTVFFDALPDYRPGEEVVAILSHDVQGMDGGTLSPYAWQFRAAVAGSDGRFVDSNQSLGNALSYAVALGDLDADGDLDAFVANATNRANKVWLNDGTGTFADSGQTLGDGSSYAVALGDLDADGDLDAFVGNSSNDEVWLNDGMGVFHDNGQYLSGSSTEGVALGDLDGDGDLDVFVANGSGANRVWLNDGTGTLFDGGQRLGSVDSEGVALGDIDADGDLDAFVANSGGEANRVWLNDGSGSFSPSGQSLDSTSSYAVALGDLDGDGDLDTFVGNASGGDTIWLNDGSGSFSPSGQSLGNSYTYAVALADVDSDGDLDGLVGTSSTDGNTIWLNNGTGYFSDSGRTLGGATAYGVALGDLDGDGDLDGFVAHSGANRVWLNRTTALAVTATRPAGNGQIIPPTAVISATFSQPLSSTTVNPNSFRVWGKQAGFYAQSYTTAGDTASFDALPDYRPGEEVVAFLSHDVQGMDGGTLSPYAWQFRAAVAGSDGRFVDSNQSLGNASSHAVALGDLDADGDLDAFAGNQNSNRVWRNDGTGSFADSGQALGDGSSYAVALGDLDSDGDLDAFVGNWSSDKVWLNDGTGSFYDSGQNLSGSSTKGVALGDLDGDGNLDAFVANWNGANRVWLNDGTGTFFDSGQRLGNVDSEDVALGDLDADGDLDAFVANSGGEANRVWLNDGASSFSPSGQSLGSTSSYAVALGDLDGDGDLDAFVGNSPGGDQVWLSDGAGSFSPTGQSLGSSYTYAVALADVDGDGDLDGLVGTSSTGGNTIWLNDGTARFTDSGRTVGGATAYGVALGDLDEDGDLDAFVAHTGANQVWLNWQVSSDPDITVDPPALSVSLHPGGTTTRTLTIGNVGGADLAWSLAKVPDVAWLSAAPGSGTVAPSDSRDVTVTFDATGLADGAYATTLRVSSNDPGTSQVDVNVVLTVGTGSGDAYEPDDTCAQASALATDGTLQSHTFHQQADVDWVHFTVVSGTTYVVQTASTGLLADTELELHAGCAAPPLPAGDLDLGPGTRLRWTASQDTTYLLRVTNRHSGDYGPQASYDLSIRAASTVGAAIVVAGRNDGRTLHSNINFAANRAARVFLDTGLSRANLYYLNSDPDPGGGLTPDAPATSANLRHAIETWAVDKVGPDRPLYLYLVDHGGLDVFLADGSGDTTSAADLDAWLATPETATECPVNVIVEACRSGSFIDDSVAELVDDVSKEGRVVIASTSAARNAYALPGQGAYFSDPFFTALSGGADLWTAFRAGQQGVAAHGLWQTPWLDDDGDATPHLYDPDDGTEARQRGLTGLECGGVAPYIETADGPAEIVDGRGTVRARVVDDLGVEFVWALVYPPSFEEPDPTDEETVVLALDSFVLLDGDGDGEYEGSYTGFTEIGAYRVVVYAKDGDGNLALPRDVTVRTGWQVYLPLILR